MLADRVRGLGGARRLHRSQPAGADPRRRRSVSRPAPRDRAAVAERAGLDSWSFAFQSASPTGEPWLGPDILEELDALHAKGVERVLVCPDRLRLRSPRDPVGPRRRGGRARRGARPRPRPDRLAERRSCIHPRAGRAGAADRFSTLAPMRPGEIVAEGVSRRFRVNPHRNLTLEGGDRPRRGDAQDRGDLGASRRLASRSSRASRSASSAATARARRRSCG